MLSLAVVLLALVAASSAVEADTAWAPLPTVRPAEPKLLLNQVLFIVHPRVLSRAAFRRSRHCEVDASQCVHLAHNYQCWVD